MLDPTAVSVSVLALSDFTGSLSFRDRVVPPVGQTALGDIELAPQYERNWSHRTIQV